MEKNIIIEYKESDDVSIEEAELRLDKAFDILFDATVDKIKKENE